LLGAYFSHEYSLEAAALFNPSIVPHPDQSDLPPDTLRFVLSLRATGEGHISSITFRTGFLDAKNNITINPPTRYCLEPAQVTSAVFPAVTGGDEGRIAIAYMGSEDCSGLSDNCLDTAHWNTYVSVLTDALSIARGGPTTVLAGKINHRVVHRGQVCTSGTTCNGDRSLLDMIDLGYDQTGRIGVVFMDNNNGLAANPRTNSSKNGPFVEFAKIRALELSTTDKALILGGNFLRLIADVQVPSFERVVASATTPRESESYRDPWLVHTAA